MSFTENKFYIRTIGCQMNSFDSSIYRTVLREYGFDETDEMNKADVILINTCAVRDKSVQKAASSIGEARSLKRTNPALLIGVVGCAAELMQKSSHRFQVDYFTGAVNATSVDSSFRTFLQEHGFFPINSSFVCSEYSLEKKRMTHFIPIIFGCNSFCTYCIVPYVRGREKSRPIPSIKHDIQKALDNGATEIVLLGQNVNCYGKDVSGNHDFPVLLDTLAQIPGILRLDFLTSHPREFTKDLLQVIRANKNIVHRFHFPLQNGDNSILQRMHRGYTVEEYLEKLSWIREIFPDASITTDLIIGFPGETEQAFQNTLKVVQIAKFDAIYGAVYSPRPGTKAAEFPDRIPLLVGKKRLNTLLDTQKQISQINLMRFLHKTNKVYVLDSSEPNLMKGKTWEDRKIHFVPCPGRKLKAGQITFVEVSSISGFNLQGKEITCQ